MTFKVFEYSPYSILNRRLVLNTARYEFSNHFRLALHRMHFHLSHCYQFGQSGPGEEDRRKFCGGRPPFKFLKIRHLNTTPQLTYAFIKLILATYEVTH